MEDVVVASGVGALGLSLRISSLINTLVRKFICCNLQHTIKYKKNPKDTTLSEHLMFVFNILLNKTKLRPDCVVISDDTKLISNVVFADFVVNLVFC